MLSVAIDLHRQVVTVSKSVDEATLHGRSDSDIEWKVNYESIPAPRYIRGFVGRSIVDDDDVGGRLMLP